MDIYSRIKQKITEMHGTNPKPFTCKVEAVDGDMCTVSIGTLKLTKVRLRSVVNNEASQLLITPKIGSYVTVVDLSGDMRHLEVVGFSEIERIDIETCDCITINCKGDMNIDCDGTTTFNGGDNHGFAKVEAVAEKLSAIEKDINSLKQVFASWVPVVYDGGASLKAGAAAWMSQTIVPVTTYQDIENTKIKH